MLFDLSQEYHIYLTVGAWDYRNYHALRVLNKVGEAMGLFTPGATLAPTEAPAETTAAP